LKSKVSLWVQLIYSVSIAIFIGLVHSEYIEIVWDYVYLTFLVLVVALISGLFLTGPRETAHYQDIYQRIGAVLFDGLVFRSDLKRDAFPWVTITFILINTLIFFSLTCLRSPGCMDEISRMT
jgi:hypothetical protein